jgi:hypothetical protein
LKTDSLIIFIQLVIFIDYRKSTRALHREKQKLKQSCESSMMTLLLDAIIDEVCPIFHIDDEDETKK